MPIIVIIMVNAIVKTVSLIIDVKKVNAYNIFILLYLKKNFILLVGKIFHLCSNFLVYVVAVAAQKPCTLSPPFIRFPFPQNSISAVFLVRSI